MDDLTEKKQRYGRGQNPNSKANLKLFKAGVSGNPAGKEVGTLDRKTTIAKWAFIEIDIVNPITKKKERGTPDDEVHLAWLRECRKGNMAAIREYLDTMYGKIIDKMDVNTNVQGSLDLNIQEAIDKIYDEPDTD